MFSFMPQSTATTWKRPPPSYRSALFRLTRLTASVGREYSLRRAAASAESVPASVIMARQEPKSRIWRTSILVSTSLMPATPKRSIAASRFMTLL